MHEIEPYYNWLKYYDSSLDDRSPFYGKEYNYDLYTETVYNYYIDPAWDSIGSETLYVKILYADYIGGYAILQFIGEWNDAINNDIMLLKRGVIDVMLKEGINKFILIGDHIFNFHGSDDSYYEEWFEEVEEERPGISPGWIAAVSFPEFIQDELKKYHIDCYICMGGTLQIDRWRTLTPQAFCEIVNLLVTRRLNP